MAVERVDGRVDERHDAPVPSHVATERLRRSLREEIDRYRRELGADLQRVAGAQGRGDDDEAIATLVAHIRSLERLQGEVSRLVADAVVEREAEAVVDVAARDASRPAPTTLPGGFERATSWTTSAPVPRRGWRAATAGLAATAAVVIGVVGLAPSEEPDRDLLAAVVASDEVLIAVQAARSGTAGDLDALQAVTGSLHEAIEGLPPEVRADPAVRRWLQVVIADQHAALLALTANVPAAAWLLADLQDLAADLDIPVPPVEAGGAVTPWTTDAPPDGTSDLWRPRGAPGTSPATGWEDRSQGPHDPGPDGERGQVGGEGADDPALVEERPSDAGGSGSDSRAADGADGGERLQGWQGARSEDPPVDAVGGDLGQDLRGDPDGSLVGGSAGRLSAE